jgi:hypothetical protein
MKHLDIKGKNADKSRNETILGIFFFLNPVAYLILSDFFKNRRKV